MGKGPLLIGEKAFEAYIVSHTFACWKDRRLRRVAQRLADSCSPRLETLRQWIGVATLRALQVNGVPEDYTVEALSSRYLSRVNEPNRLVAYLCTGLVLRVLYRLRTLSEQSPFDAATFSYAAPLFNEILIKGGVGIEGEDDPGEQIILVLDIISFHAAECASISTLPGSFV